MNLHQPLYRHASYREKAVRPDSLAELVEDIAAFFEQEGVEFDTIACCGISGLLVAPMLAWYMGKELLVIHKRDDGSHSPYEVEGNVGTERYVIIDDLIDTGNTVRHIKDMVQHRRCTYGWEAQHDPKCVGVYLYSAMLAGRKQSAYWQTGSEARCSSYE